MLAVIEETKRRRGTPISVAVAGADGRVIGFISMDGALIISLKLAQSKAHSAVVFGRNTMHWEKRNPPLNNADLGDPDFTCLGGGVIVEVDGHTLGGIGISGGKSDGDENLAIFGRELIKRSIPTASTNME